MVLKKQFMKNNIFLSTNILRIISVDTLLLLLLLLLLFSRTIILFVMSSFSQWIHGKKSLILHKSIPHIRDGIEETFHEE